MPVEDNAGVGDRNAWPRRLACLTQRQLAEKANKSLVRKVERGDRPASPTFVVAVARALGSSPDALYGQPYEPTTQTEAATHAAIPEMRRVLVAFDDNDLPEQPPTLEELTASLSRIWQMHRRARLGEGLAALPDGAAWPAPRCRHDTGR